MKSDLILPFRLSTMLRVGMPFLFYEVTAREEIVSINLLLFMLAATGSYVVEKINNQLTPLSRLMPFIRECEAETS